MVARVEGPRLVASWWSGWKSGSPADDDQTRWSRPDGGLGAARSPTSVGAQTQAPQLNPAASEALWNWAHILLRLYNWHALRSADGHVRVYYWDMLRNSVQLKPVLSLERIGHGGTRSAGALAKQSQKAASASPAVPAACGGDLPHNALAPEAAPSSKAASSSEAFWPPARGHSVGESGVGASARRGLVAGLARCPCCGTVRQSSSPRRDSGQGVGCEGHRAQHRGWTLSV